MTKWAMLLVAGALVGVAACEAQPPDNGRPPVVLADAGGSDYADLVVSYTENGVTQTCTEAGLAVCGAQQGSCADHESLGAPDGVIFSLEPGGLLEIGFVCRPILDRVQGETPVPDFRVVATGASDSNAGVVSVSRDGDSYQSLGTLRLDNQEFYITDEGFDFVRFIRISGGSTAPIQVDAIEALR